MAIFHIRHKPGLASCNLDFVPLLVVKGNS